MTAPFDPFNGWEAHLLEDWPTGGHRLYLRRLDPDHRARFITQLDDGPPTQLTYDVNAVALDNDGEPFRGLLLPAGVAQAIADAVNPGPGRAELACLEAALTLEQQRVDRILGSLLT